MTDCNSHFNSTVFVYTCYTSQISQFVIFIKSLPQIQSDIMFQKILYPESLGFVNQVEQLSIDYILVRLVIDQYMHEGLIQEKYTESVEKQVLIMGVSKMCVCQHRLPSLYDFEISRTLNTKLTYSGLMGSCGRSCNRDLETNGWNIF